MTPPPDAPDEVYAGPPLPEGRPLLSTGLAAAVLANGAGELALTQEARGGLTEWGGVYAQGIRLTGPWRLAGEVAGARFALLGTTERIVHRRSGILSTHRWGPVEVTQRIWALPQSPAVIRRLTLRTDVAGEVRLLSSWSPFLAPVLVEGVKPYDYRLSRSDGVLEVRSHGHGLRVASDVPVDSWSVNGVRWTGPADTGEVEVLQSEQQLVLPSGVGRSVGWVVWGGLDRTLDHGGIDGPGLLAGGGDGGPAASEGTWTNWFDRAPRLELPDDPELATAYRLALGALRTLYTRPDPEVTGLVAGYPWYAALWCRDLAWMLPAVCWSGDVEWAAASIESVFRFQANAHIPLLGAEAGELPMQLSPGPVFLYGTSDTTLYYAPLVARLLRHGASPDLLGRSWRHLEALERWAHARTDPRTGLLRNGGEVAEIRDASASLGRIHYGFDAVDTTIWDSTDRRAHAIDVQVLLHATYAALAELAPSAGAAGSAAGWNARATQVATAIAERYDWPDEGYLVDSLSPEGSPVRRLRPNALRAVSAGLVGPARGRAAITRVAREDLSTEWGVRTLARTDPGYDPMAYHDGQVWPIATAWAADAAYAVGDPARGLGWLRQLAHTIVAERGFAGECYHGDRPEPFDSCFLLGFSVAPLLQLVFERLWGLSVEARVPAIAVAPAFPPEWRSASLTGLRVGEGRVDLVVEGPDLCVRWNGTRPLALSAGESRCLVPPGPSGVTVPRPRQP